MPPESNVESTLIWYRGTGQADYKYWKESLVEFLKGKFTSFIIRKEDTIIAFKIKK